MKKILVDEAIFAALNHGARLLHRVDVKVFTAATSDDILSLHKTERMNVIIYRLDAPGTAAESLFNEIRNDNDLRRVSLILCCRDQPDEKARAERCCPNAIMTMPVNSSLLLDKAGSLMDVPSRGTYRVLVSVSMDATLEKPFFCRSRNISASGMLLETDRNLVPKNHLTCSFFLPGSKQIVVAGEIVREIKNADKTGTKHFGVKFIKIAPRDVTAINEFVRKKTEKTS
jgi:DNA-binding response OmpR family regulator